MVDIDTDIVIPPPAPETKVAPLLEVVPKLPYQRSDLYEAVRYVEDQQQKQLFIHAVEQAYKSHQVLITLMKKLLPDLKSVELTGKNGAELFKTYSDSELNIKVRVAVQLALARAQQQDEVGESEYPSARAADDPSFGEGEDDAEFRQMIEEREAERECKHQVVRPENIIDVKNALRAVQKAEDQTEKKLRHTWDQNSQRVCMSEKRALKSVQSLPDYRFPKTAVKKLKDYPSGKGVVVRRWQDLPMSHSVANTKKNRALTAKILKYLCPAA